MNDDARSSHRLGPDLDAPKKIKTRKRNKEKSNSTSFLSSLIPKDLALTITIPEEDKRQLLEKLDTMTSKFDRRWKITQYLIAIGMVLNAISYILSG